MFLLENIKKGWQTLSKEKWLLMMTNLNMMKQATLENLEKKLKLLNKDSFCMLLYIFCFTRVFIEFCQPEILATNLR